VLASRNTLIAKEMRRMSEVSPFARWQRESGNIAKQAIIAIAAKPPFPCSWAVL
jgi:hypothetical protein